VFMGSGLLGMAFADGVSIVGIASCGVDSAFVRGP